MKIHLVKTRLVNSYVIEYADKLLVMDVAAKCHRYVLGFVEQTLKRDISDIKLVICSHDDPDHIGGVFRLASLCGAQVAIPYASRQSKQKFINDPSGVLVRTITIFREAFRMRAWEMYFNPNRNQSARQQPKLLSSVQDAGDTDKIGSVLRLKHNTVLPFFEDWLVIHTPGHSWDSCCFYHEESESLLSGDTLLGSAKKGHLVTPSIYSNPRQMRQTMKELESRVITTVYPGHGSVIEDANIAEGDPRERDSTQKS